MKLKELAEDLKVGDVFWVRAKIKSTGDQGVPLEDRQFSFEEYFPNCILGANVYGDNEVFVGELSQTVVEKEVIKEVDKILPDEKSKGMIEAYENILFKKKITIE